MNLKLSDVAKIRRPRINKPLSKLGFPLRAPSTPLSVEPLPPAPKTGTNFDTDWARSDVARAARAVMVDAVMKPAVTALAAPSIQGVDRLAAFDDANLIFAANHHSHIDTPLLLSSIPLPWRRDIVVGAAADYFFNNRVKAAASALALGAFPIERSKVGRKSADEAARLLDDGWSLLIYPEGGRSPDGWGRPFRGGAAYLAQRCRVPVVPIHIEGTGRILRKGNTLPKPSNTKVTFGAPILPEPDERSARFAKRIEQAVAQLADEATTDWWSARQRAHNGTTPPLAGPNAGAWRRVWALNHNQNKKNRRAWPRL
ncbi:MAG: lysophospholipid acyltransferase family protein [Acidimicrobiales bacterium]